MSFWANALADFLSTNDMNSAAAAKASGISPSVWSRWKSGDQVEVSDEHWEIICAKVARRPQEQAELLRARMLDKLHGTAADRLEINIVGRKSVPDPSPGELPKVNLAPRTHRAISRILERLPTDDRLRDLIQSIADLGEGK